MIVAFAVQAAAASLVAFAPPLDRPLLLEVEERREVGGVSRRFTASRRILFRRDSGGLVAEVELLRVGTDAEPAVARRFLPAATGLQGRVVRFRLAADGRVVAVDDADAVWAAAARGFAGVAPPRPAAGPAPRGEALMAAVPPERRLAVLASALAELVAVDEARAPVGVRAVTVAPPAFTGDPRPIAGSRTTSRTADGRVELITRAGDHDRGVSLERRRLVDPAIGMTVEADEVLTLTRGTAEQVTRTRWTLRAEP